MGEPPRVLVVDDDAGIRDVLDLALTDAGYAVALAADGATALTMIDAVAPDVILLDMRMPVLDGWAFAEAYRRRPGRSAPIVVMTAARDAPEHAAQIAATAYLAKPFDLADLLACVAQYSPSHE
jgi:two-component system, chemotaxis family, chemotaxis protein CheY